MKQFLKISLCSLFLFFLSCKDQELTELHQDSFIKPETNSSFEFSIDDYKKIPIVIQKNARIAKDDPYTKKNQI